MSCKTALRRLAVVCLQLAISLPIAFGTPAEGAGTLPPVVGASELYASARLSGVALEGFDPLSYQINGAPRPGNPGHEYVWRGLAWRFANAANRAAFIREPETFAPRIGGYDAERVANDLVVQADPEIFSVQSGALYLFRSADHRSRFLADEDSAARAEASWQRLRPSLVQG